MATGVKATWSSRYFQEIDIRIREKVIDGYKKKIKLLVNLEFHRCVFAENPQGHFDRQLFLTDGNKADGVIKKIIYRRESETSCPVFG